jgi:PIN domain nuclease of toxin-antitoxin system
MPKAEAILLDTHALLWWQAGSQRLSAVASRRLAAASSILVSAISCWEVGMLVRRGRVRLDRPTAAWVRDLLASDRVVLAELTPSVAVTAAELEGFHGDPADRLLYATARRQAVPLVTKDRLIRRYAKADGAVTAVW